LTITNFSGNPGLAQNGWINGYANLGNYDELYLGGFQKYEDGVLWSTDTNIKGNILTIQVWKWDGSTYTPFLGNTNVAAGNLFLDSYSYSPSWEHMRYINKVPITFTNGNATINFGTQMEEYQY